MGILGCMLKSQLVRYDSTRSNAYARMYSSSDKTAGGINCACCICSSSGEPSGQQLSWVQGW